MHTPKKSGMFALAIYLIIVGCMGSFGLSLGSLSILVPCLAIVAGLLLLMGRQQSGLLFAACHASISRPHG
jgi:ABC-type multidrug transport system permease subunit